MLEKEKRKSIHGPTIIDQGLSDKPNYANIIITDFVNITGEPAKMASKAAKRAPRKPQERPKRAPREPQEGPKSAGSPVMLTKSVMMMLA